MNYATLWYTLAMNKEYEQYCPMALGLERIGERWTLLIVRDLMFGPMRYSDLKAGIPGIATNMLANRLSEMQDAGIIPKRELPPPAASTVYELTELGRGLAPVLLELGKWGMNFLPEHDKAGFVREGLRQRAMIAAEHTSSSAEAYTLIVDGEVIGFDVRPGSIEVLDSPAPDSAVTLSLSSSTLMELMLLGKSVAEAEEEGKAKVQGDPAAAERLLNLFRLPGTEPAVELAATN